MRAPFAFVVLLLATSVIVGCSRGSEAPDDLGGDARNYCGNGVVEAGETCDGSCPTSCDDGSDCTVDRLFGTAAGCDVLCRNDPLAVCMDGDGCCGLGCSISDDDDCSSLCTLTTPCADDDDCCPVGCSSIDDNNCSVECGNGVVDVGETCDGSCPTSCDDGNPCTGNVRMGSSAACNVTCMYPAIGTCTNGDTCCPGACTSGNDNDCSPTGPACGNGIVEAGETCDGNCPTSAASCNDGNACTTDSVNGTACTRVCAHAMVTACANGDSCCPSGCNSSNDNDCSCSCGNGVVETACGELCDGNCPTVCASDGNACTQDVLVGSAASCNRQCTHPAITTCTNDDGCCPGTCTSTNDNDCPPPTASTCTLIYNLTPQFRIDDTPLGAGDGTFTMPEGKLVLRMQANGAGGPLSGGTAELLFLWADIQFSQTTSGLTIGTNVNHFVATCNGTTNPVPAGQSPPNLGAPPDPCAYTDATSSMATGTFSGTQIAWAACARHGDYSGANYEPADTSVSTGPGCARNYRSVGIVNCSGGGFLVGCSSGGLSSGQNLDNATFNQPLEPLTFTNGVQNTAMSWIQIPNTKPGSTGLQLTGVRAGAAGTAAGGTCL